MDNSNRFLREKKEVLRPISAETSSSPAKHTVHYTEDPKLSKCAIALLKKIAEKTQQGLYATNEEILHTFEIGLEIKHYARRTAVILLTELGYVQKKRVSKMGSRLAWTCIKEFRPIDAVRSRELSELNHYWYVPKVSKSGGGFVYIIKRIRDGIYKIGQTKEPRKRFGCIASNSGSHVDVIAYIDCKQYLSLEIEMHEKFSENLLMGEWYEFTDKKLKEVVQAFLQASRELDNSSIFITPSLKGKIGNG